jgi:hypothetical protein
LVQEDSEAPLELALTLHDVWPRHVQATIIGDLKTYFSNINTHYGPFDTKINFKVGVVDTMDHEVVPRPYKICDWRLNSLWGHFSLHQEKKNVKVTMKFEVPKRHILRPTLYANMVQHVL